MADTLAKPRQVDLALLAEISAAFNSRDVDRIMALFHEDATFYLATGPEPVGRAIRGKAAIREMLAARFARIPDMHWKREYEYVTPPDRAVTVWRVTGKAADGTELNHQGCDLYTFRDGLIIGKDTYWKRPA